MVIGGIVFSIDYGDKVIMIRVCNFCKILIEEGNTVHESRASYLHKECFWIKWQKEKRNNDKLNEFWTDIQIELIKPEFSHLSNIQVVIKNASYDLQFLFVAAQDKKWKVGSALNQDSKNQLQALVSDGISTKNIKTILQKENYKKLNELQMIIKIKLAESNFSRHLSGTINIKNKKYVICALFHVLGSSNSPKQIHNHNWEKEMENELQTLINNRVTVEDFSKGFKTFLRVNNQKLDALWEDIKTKLAKPEFSQLISIATNYRGFDLRNLSAIVKIKSEREKMGCALNQDIKDKLQLLVSKGITSLEKFQSTLENNMKLDVIWKNIKEKLIELKFSHLLSITINHKNYKLNSLSVAAESENARQKAGSALNQDTKNQLQALVSDGISSESIKGALENTESSSNVIPLFFAVSCLVLIILFVALIIFI